MTGSTNWEVIDMLIDEQWGVAQPTITKQVFINAVKKATFEEEGISLTTFKKFMTKVPEEVLSSKGKSALKYAKSKNELAVVAILAERIPE